MACGCEGDSGVARHSGRHGCSCGCGCGSHREQCCCGSHFHVGPAFWTRDEKVAWLESRLEELQERAGAIQERIAALRAEG